MKTHISYQMQVQQQFIHCRKVSQTVTWNNWIKGSSIVRQGQKPGSLINECHDGAHFYLGLDFTLRNEACLNAWEKGLTSSKEDNRDRKRFGENIVDLALKSICHNWYNDDYSWLPLLREFYQKGFAEQNNLEIIRNAYLFAMSKRNISA